MTNLCRKFIWNNPDLLIVLVDPLLKKERIKKFKEIGDKNYIYKNELDKACFQHDVAYGYFKDLPKRTVSDKVLRDKAFNGYQRGLVSIVYKFFVKNSGGNCVILLANKSAFNNEILAEELHKPITEKF